MSVSSPPGVEQERANAAALLAAEAVDALARARSPADAPPGRERVLDPAQRRLELGEVAQQHVDMRVVVDPVEPGLGVDLGV